MQITENDAKQILEAFRFLQSEAAYESKDIDLAKRILTAFPKLEKQYSYLRSRWGE